MKSLRLILDIVARLLAIFGALTVLGALTGRVHWALDFLGLFLLFGIWAIVAAIAIFFLRGQKRFGFGLAALMLVAVIGPLAIRFGATPPPADGDMVRVYQHNTWSRNPQKYSLNAGIIAQDAELLVLLEAVPWQLNGYILPVLQEFGYAVKDSYRRSPLTRIQIHSKRVMVEQTRKRTRSGAAIAAGQIEIGGVQTHIVALHLARPWPFDDPNRQMRQANEIIEILGNLDGPMLILGDFNAPPWGRIIKRLESGFGARAYKPGFQSTWPAEIALGETTIPMPKRLGIPIDLVLVRGNIGIYDWQTAPALGSDHRAVVFELGPKPN